jgi:glycosyltransferase involved in cell wall biosynthesis
MDAPWEDVARAGDWLLELEQRTKPDIIHLNNFVHGALPFRAPKVVVGHSCVLSWWQAVKQEPAPAEWSLYANKVRAGLQAADVVISPSRMMLDALITHYGPFARSKVIANGRDPAAFKPAAKEPIILTAGRLWDEAKNIAALASISSDIPWNIYIAGDDRHPNGKTVKHKNLCPLGRLPADLLAKWMAKAAIFASPARYEPFGLSALEAGLSGCSLVLGNIPSLREIWNGAALFVSPNDPEELKFTLDALIRNPARRREMASFAQCRAIQFTPKRMASDYFSVYRDALARHTQTLSSRLEPVTKEVFCES